MRNYKKYNSNYDFNKYYTRDDTYTTMNPSLIGHVDFNYHNLTIDTNPNNFDIIFVAM